MGSSWALSVLFLVIHSNRLSLTHLTNLLLLVVNFFIYPVSIDSLFSCVPVNYLSCLNDFSSLKWGQLQFKCSASTGGLSLVGSGNVNVKMCSEDVIPLELPVCLHYRPHFFNLPLFILILAHFDTSPAAVITTAGPGPGPTPGCCSAAALCQPTAQCCWCHHLSLCCHTHDTDPLVSAYTDCTGE